MKIDKLAKLEKLNYADFKFLPSIKSYVSLFEIITLQEEEFFCKLIHEMSQTHYVC